MYRWTPGQPNQIVFVMVDADGIEVSALEGFDVELAHGESFVTGTGTKREIGNGWYAYTATSEECPPEGVVAIRVTASGCLQQNLVAEVAIPGAGSAGIGTGLYTDTVTDGAVPLDGVRVQLSTDAAGENRVYEAFTNALGVFTLHPDPGTYYRWLDLAGYSFEQGVLVEVEAL